MTKSRKDRACVDCGMPTTGTRCRQHDGEYRKGRPRARKRSTTPRPRMLPLAVRYPMPEPSQDRRPLTREELEHADCAQVDSEIFYAEKGKTYTDAQKVCSGCEIAARCFAAHLDEETGFFASTPKQRRRVRDRIASEEARTAVVQPWPDTEGGAVA